MNTYQKFVFKICLITSVIIIMLPMQSHAQVYKNLPLINSGKSSKKKTIVLNIKWSKKLNKKWRKNNIKHFQKRKSITYSLNSNINDTYHTYCSKLVWQSYYFGAGKKSVNSTGVYHYFNPYNLPKNIKGTKKVKTFF